MRIVIIVGSEFARSGTRMLSLSKHALLLVVAFVSLTTNSAAIATEPLSERVVHYAIEARLDPAAKMVTGREVVTWKNTTNRPAADLFFHLCLNAFANDHTTFLTDRADAVEKWSRKFPGEWGWIDVKSVRIGDADATSRLEFVQPDDSNPHDRTVARLPLAMPVRPGESITFTIEFESRLPRVIARAGHADPFFFVAQWFPKLGVFQNGQWKCRQYHSNAEFFADFGVFDVQLTVPTEYVIGHTGQLMGGRDRGDGTTTYTVRAEDVHDFAWTADPRFIVHDDAMEGTAIRLLMQPQHDDQAERYLSALRAAMERFSRWFGRYPYPTLTVVDPGHGGAGAGGMEYPMLITAGTRRGLPSWLRFPEAVVVHEFGHQYWYGMVANDEAEEAWLDEGINSFVEGEIMDDIYGVGHSYVDAFDLGLDAVSHLRLGYLRQPSADRVTRPAAAMLDADSYFGVTYGKTALTLYTLDRYLGGNRLREALADYFEKWRFRHPTGADFRRSIEESVGENLEWFFSQTLDGEGVLDYAVTAIDVREMDPPRGRGFPEGQEDAEVRYRTEVTVRRLGDVQIPVDVLIAFDGGSLTRETWDGRERFRKIEVIGNKRADYAVVDPDHKLSLDVNRLNNSRMRRPATRGIIRLSSRWSLWVQNLLHFVTAF